MPTHCPRRRRALPPCRREPRRRRRETAVAGGAGTAGLAPAGSRHHRRGAAGRGRGLRRHARLGLERYAAHDRDDRDGRTAIKKGLAGVVQRDVWDKCAVSSTPLPGAVESAICLPPTNGTANFPDRVDLSIYPDAAALKKAFNELRASDPHSAALVAGKGNCNNINWNGFGIWRHASTAIWAAERYCYATPSTIRSSSGRTNGSTRRATSTSSASPASAGAVTSATWSAGGTSGTSISASARCRAAMPACPDPPQRVHPGFRPRARRVHPDVRSSSWRSRLLAAEISARCVKACGKLPSASPDGPICSA